MTDRDRVHFITDLGTVFMRAALYFRNSHEAAQEIEKGLRARGWVFMRMDHADVSAPADVEKVTHS